jgi:hypothetical protein
LSGEDLIGVCDIDAPFEISCGIVEERSDLKDRGLVVDIGFEFKGSHSDAKIRVDSALRNFRWGIGEIEIRFRIRDSDSFRNQNTEAAKAAVQRWRKEFYRKDWIRFNIREIQNTEAAKAAV